MKNWTQLYHSTNFRAFLSARRRLLMLDYDGTLAPFTVQRRKAAPYPGVRRILNELTRAGGWRVVIISGRTASEVAAFLKPERGLEIFGCHGGERLDTEGRVTREPIGPGHAATLEKAWRWAMERGLADRLERKHGCLALHVRGLTPPAARDLLAEAGRAFALLLGESGESALRPFDGGIELRPADFDKGRVVRRLLAEEKDLAGGEPRAAAYLGDDLTDEDAFAALGEADLRVLVGAGRDRTLAEYLLRPPGELLEFLQAGTLAKREPAAPQQVAGATRRGRLVVVSNRLPIALERTSAGWKAKSGAGGLVTALAPVLRDRGGLWVGASGAGGDAAPPTNAPFDAFSRQAGYTLLPVELTEEEHHNYYEGFANNIIWPLFHDFQSYCAFNPEYWASYLEVNRKFAAAVAAHSTPDDYIWIHDYHLMHVASALREQGASRRCGFFLHIPFPTPDIFLKLPWRRQVLAALLEHGLVGFQTLADRRNFVRCVRVLFPQSEFWGRGAVISAEIEGRTVRIGSFPISIDYAAFARLAADPRTTAEARRIRAGHGDRKIVLSVDRLDYSKGVPQRLQAIHAALTKHPDLRRRLDYIQVLVPSREGVGDYRALKNEIERLVSRINGEFTESDWVPVHHLYRTLARPELAAHYRAADIAMITSLRDGMNLVAKEYCAANVTEDGALVLSEFTGVAAQFQRLGAMLVNPYDIEETAETLYAACRLPLLDRKMRMRKLRESVRRNNISVWVDGFLRAAFSRQLDDFSPLETVQFHEKRPLRERMSRGREGLAPDRERQTAPNDPGDGVPT